MERSGQDEQFLTGFRMVHRTRDLELHLAFQHQLQAIGRPADLVAIFGRTHPVSDGKGFGTRPMN
jgi:hypothetical protein